MSDPLSRFAQRWAVESPETAMTRAVRHLAQRAGHTRAPHPLVPAARALGARIYEENVASAVLRVEGPPVVLVPRQPWRTWRRQRFSIAHELCHLLIWRAVPEDERGALQDPALHDELERLCDLGAAEILMPTAEFSQDLTTCEFHSAGLAALYDRYLVSWMSLMNRFTTVLPSAGLSLWRLGTRPDDPHDLPRAVASWGWSSRTYIPPGISEQHLSRTMLSTALNEGRAWSMDLRLGFIRGQPTVAAIACPMPGARPQQEMLPLWVGRSVPDEPRVHAHAVLAVLDGQDAEATLDLLIGDRPRDSSRPQVGAAAQC